MWCINGFFNKCIGKRLLKVLDPNNGCHSNRNIETKKSKKTSKIVFQFCSKTKADPESYGIPSGIFWHCNFDKKFFQAFLRDLCSILEVRIYEIVHIFKKFIYRTKNWTRLPINKVVLNFLFFVIFQTKSCCYLFKNTSGITSLFVVEVLNILTRSFDNLFEQSTKIAEKHQKFNFWIFRQFGVIMMCFSSKKLQLFLQKNVLQS